MTSEFRLVRALALPTFRLRVGRGELEDFDHFDGIGEGCRDSWEDLGAPVRRKTILMTSILSWHVHKV